MAPSILVVDDEAALREILGILFKRSGFEVALASGFRQAADLLQSGRTFDLVVTDLAMPDGSGMEVLNLARQREVGSEVIMITAYGTTEQAVQAMRLGAYDYIQKPFRNDELLAIAEKALEKRAIVDENRALRRRVTDSFRTSDFVGKNPAVLRVLDMVKRVASAPSSVLITGESGTGKELVARSLHGEGERSKNPFVAVNCAALPEPLLESELFGHEKGAFTGATSSKEGLFRAADRGTLFLDEVGELPSSLQVKLLRVLQERRVRPVGGQRESVVDVRLVAATNRDVEREVAEGRFRRDLFYRLNVIRLHLPPLRERPDDIPLLAEHFLLKHAALQQKRLAFAPEALRWLATQQFPGNVRELENILERAATLATGARVELTDLPAEDMQAVSLPSIPPLLLPDRGFDLEKYLGDIERMILTSALEKAGGVRKRAAELLGVSFRSIRYRMAKYGFGDDDSLPTEGSEEE